MPEPERLNTLENNTTPSPDIGARAIASPLDDVGTLYSPDRMETVNLRLDAVNWRDHVLLHLLENNTTPAPDIGARAIMAGVDEVGCPIARVTRDVHGNCISNQKWKGMT